ncbi:MAG: hypothetical protein JEZ05_02120 [Tenericutes bacterium]|nr:hypothetical protein [Mycoplasmatota bacterium]
MYSDISGYSFKSIFNDIRVWWNSVPDNVGYKSSGSSVWKYVGSALLGVGMSGGSNYFDYAGKLITWNRGNLYGAVSSSLTWIGGGITILSMLYEYGEIWNSDNGNTNGNRLIKCLIETTKTVSTIFAISGFATIAGASLAATGTLLATPVILAAVAVIGVVLIVNYGADWLYDELDIE